EADARLRISGDIYSDLPDLLGRSDRRFSRRSIRLMASKVLPFNSGRRCTISSRAVSSSAFVSSFLAMWPQVGLVFDFSSLAAPQVPYHDLAVWRFALEVLGGLDGDRLAVT